jgi:hypothetical protein
MGSYKNLNRPGVRTSTTVDPKIVMEDISNTIRRLEPEATPMQSLSNWIGRGTPPKNHKIQVIQYHAFDHFDFCSTVVLGSSIDAGYGRFARLTLDQASRPDVNTTMYYQPQDKLYIAETGQTVEIWMTPTSTRRIGLGTTDFYSTVAGFSGDGTTTTAAGSVIVRNINPDPIKSFTTSDIVYMGRTIHESQVIEATPAQRDYVFDCNFVEHKEQVIEMTEDQRDLITMKGVAPDWTMQQREMIIEFKKSVEFNAVLSSAEVDLTVPGRPMRHMRGLLDTIKTNVAFYNPASVSNYENLLIDFVYNQAFRYNPGGTKKFAICGAEFFKNFNKTFSQYRTTNTLDLKEKVGFNVQAYYFGNYQLNIIQSELFRQGTKFQDWCMVFDPQFAKWRVKKDYLTKEYSLANERVYKLMVEWQGTIAWELEQSHALLRTA